MLRFVVAGMAVVILALAGVMGFLVYENLSEDDGGGTTSAESEAPTGWEAVSYADKHSICQDFATTTYAARTVTDDDKYQACMECGPQYAKDSGYSDIRWWCPPYSIWGSQ